MGYDYEGPGSSTVKRHKVRRRKGPAGSKVGKIYAVTGALQNRNVRCPRMRSLNFIAAGCLVFLFLLGGAARELAHLSEENRREIGRGPAPGYQREDALSMDQSPLLRPSSSIRRRSVLVRRAPNDFYSEERERMIKSFAESLERRLGLSKVIAECVAVCSQQSPCSLPVRLIVTQPPASTTHLLLQRLIMLSPGTALQQRPTRHPRGLWARQDLARLSNLTRRGHGSRPRSVLGLLPRQQQPQARLDQHAQGRRSQIAPAVSVPSHRGVRRPAPELSSTGLVAGQ